MVAPVAVDATNVPPPTRPKKGKLGSKKVCNYEDCKNKLTFVEKTSLVCRCGGAFCGTHRPPERHDCSKLAERIKEQQDNLEKKLTSAAIDKSNDGRLDRL